MATLANCSYALDRAETLGESIVNVDFAMRVVYGVYACTPWKWEYAVNLICVLLWLVVYRWSYDLFMRFQRRHAHEKFNLAQQLTTRDNPALAIDFASFLFAMCIITRGSLTDLQPGVDTSRYFGGFFAYQCIGSTVIVASRVLNDWLMLRDADNVKAMVDEHSVAVACVQAGTTVATALIFAASAGGSESSFAEGVVLTLIYWVIGQVLLISYTNIVDCVTSLPVVSSFAVELVSRAPVGPSDVAIGGTSTSPSPPAAADSTSEASADGQRATSLFREAAAGNPAAGLSIGLDLVHAGMLIAAPIYVGYSVLPWVIFVAASLGVVSPIMHLYFDHIVLRGAAYSVNILRHRNWGAAVLLGALKILLALVLTSSYKQNCEPSTLNNGCTEATADSMFARLAAFTVPDVFTLQLLSNLVVLLLFTLLAKLVFFLRFAAKDGLGSLRANLRTFSLDATLADPRNNAVAVSLAAFIFSIGLALVGVVFCPDYDSPSAHAATVLLWTSIGSGLSLLAFALNHRVLLARLSNTEALLDNNVAVGCLEAGSFVACGLILRGTLTGGDDQWSFAESLALTVLFWAVSQLLLLLTTFVYRAITFFDDWQELKKGNVAAGLSGGLTLVALSTIMAYPIPMYTSLIIVLPIALAGIAALMVVRKVVDCFVLPGNALDREIVDDQNWGAAIIEGGVAVGIALIANLYCPPPGAPYVSDDVPYWDVCG